VVQTDTMDNINFSEYSVVPPATQKMSSENAIQQHELLSTIRQLQAEISEHRKFLQQARTRGAAQQQQQQAVVAIGKTLCFVIKKEIKINFILIIVADESMGHDTIFKRDFMGICGLSTIY